MKSGELPLRITPRGREQVGAHCAQLDSALASLAAAAGGEGSVDGSDCDPGPTVAGFDLVSVSLCNRKHNEIPAL